MGYLHLKDKPTQVVAYPVGTAPVDLDARLEFSEGDVTELFGGPVPQGQEPWAYASLPTKPTGPEIASAITSLLLELPLATQAGFSQATATIGYFLDKNNPALALALLQEVNVPQDLEPLKAAVAAEIQKGV